MKATFFDIKSVEMSGSQHSTADAMSSNGPSTTTGSRSLRGDDDAAATATQQRPPQTANAPATASAATAVPAGPGIARKVPAKKPAGSSSRFLLLILGALIGIIFGVVFTPDAKIKGRRIVLGQGGYDKYTIRLPAMRGRILDLFSRLTVLTRLGPWIRRKLLNANDVHMLRELAAQTTLPPLQHPMVRVSEQDWQQMKAWSERLGWSMDDVMTHGLPNASDADLLGANVMDYARLYRSGAVKPSSAMQRSLAAVKAFELQGQRIFSFIDENDVMRQARASDNRFAQGQPLSIFDGVPISIKDFIHVKGYTILSGKDPSKNWTSSVAVADDPIVSRFRDLGAIIFGLTVMTEGGMGNFGYNIHYQGCHNPYSSEHFPGGSSSGAVASVASGIVPVAIGVDAGGSIRTPSGLSGVHGLAATYGRVSASPSLVGRVLLKFGPMARTAADLALAHLVLSGPTDISDNDYYRVMYDGNIRGPPPPQLNQFSDIDDLRDVRIGVFDEWSKDSSEEVYAANRRALDFFVSRGATLVPITIPHLRWQALSHVLRLNVDFALNWDSIASQRLLDLEPSTRISYGLGSVVSALELAAIDRFRAWSFEYIEDLFKHHNLSAIATPTAPILAPRLTDAEKSFGISDSATSVALLRYVFLSNNLGLPSTSVPIGFGTAPDTGASLPIGMQLVSWHWREDVLLRLAHAVDHGLRSNSTGHLRQPPLYVNPLQA